MADTFGGEHRRPQADGQGHSQRELQDRASYDCAPRAGVSCLLIVGVSLAMWAGIIAAAVEVVA